MQLTAPQQAHGASVRVDLDPGRKVSGNAEKESSLTLYSPNPDVKLGYAPTGHLDMGTPASLGEPEHGQVRSPGKRVSVSVMRT